MTDLRTAFPTPGGALPWGIRLEDAATRLGCVPEYGARIAWPGGDLLGLPVLRGEASAPAPDRPVLSVEYALPPDPAARGDTLPWWRELQALFGTPDALDRYEPPGGQWHSSSVRANARWRGEVLDIAYCVYGGPREGAVAHLGLHWPEALAAQPYLVDWRARSAALADLLAEPATAITEFPLVWEAAASAPGGSEARERHLALYAPRLLATPAALGKRLGARRFALWHRPDGAWGLSNRHESVWLAPGEAARVIWIELQPAKGGGWSGLSLDRWEVRSAPGAAAIRDAAEAIARRPGMQLHREEGYDC